MMHLESGESFSLLDNKFCCIRFMNYVAFKKLFALAGKIDYIDEGDVSYECKFCGSLFWFNERCKSDNKKAVAEVFSLCCLKGKIKLPHMTAPPPVLYRLFFDKKLNDSKLFHENIRQYNNMFSFTSMGGKIDHSKNIDNAPYSFVLSGVNYHHIGSLLPPPGQQPAFSQLYIHDTANEISNRIAAVRYNSLQM